MVSTTYIFALVALLASSVSSTHAHKHASALKARAETTPGCYKGKEGFTFERDDPWMTEGLCVGFCKEKTKAAILVSGTDCFCGDLLPRKKNKVDAKFCDTKCPGYGTVMCKFERLEYVEHTLRIRRWWWCR